MTISASDIDRIMGHLCYPVTQYYVGMVSFSCELITKNGGFVAEDRLIGYLDTLDTLQENAIAGSLTPDGDIDDRYLIKADVLEWQAPTVPKSTFIKRDYQLYLSKLFCMLGLEPHDRGGGNISVRS
jgi:hypothetical protein